MSITENDTGVTTLGATELNPIADSEFVRITVFPVSDSDDDNFVDRRALHSFALRSFNEKGKKVPSFEEEIIKNRGRRQMPRTPVRKSSRKRITDSDDNDSTDVSEEQQKQFQQSPFTKCLSTIRTTPKSSSSRIARKLRPLIGLESDGKVYSPNTRVLRSSARSMDSSFNDSGIEMTPSTTFNSTNPSMETIMEGITPQPPPSVRRVRKRFRF